MVLELAATEYDYHRHQRVLVKACELAGIAVSEIPTDPSVLDEVESSGTLYGVHLLEASGPFDCWKIARESESFASDLELAAMLSLYRSGPLEYGVTEQFVRSRPVIPDSRLRRRHLGATRGCVCFPEQAHEILHMAFFPSLPGATWNASPTNSGYWLQQNFPDWAMEAWQLRSDSEQQGMLEQIRLVLRASSTAEAECLRHARLTIKSAWIKAHSPEQLEAVRSELVETHPVPFLALSKSPENELETVSASLHGTEMRALCLFSSNASRNRYMQKNNNSAFVETNLRTETEMALHSALLDPAVAFVIIDPVPGQEPACQLTAASLHVFGALYPTPGCFETSFESEVEWDRLSSPGLPVRISV